MEIKYATTTASTKRKTTINTLKIQSKLAAAMAAMTFTAALAPIASAQCVSGVGGSHIYGLNSVDFKTVSSATTGASYTFVRPTKISADGAYVNVLDQGTNSWVQLTWTGSNQPILASVRTFLSAPVDLITGGPAGPRVLDVSGRETFLGPTGTMGPLSVQVTPVSPVAMINIGNSDWVTANTGILYQVSIGVPTPAALNGVKVTAHNLGKNQLGVMAYDGINLWVGSGNSLVQVDPTTGNQLGEFNVGVTVTALTYDGVYLWIGGGAGLRKFDPALKEQTNAQDLSIAGPVTGLHFDGSWVWVANESATIERVRACDATDLGGITLPGPVNAITMSDSGLWMTYQNAPTISVR